MLEFHEMAKKAANVPEIAEITEKQLDFSNSYVIINEICDEYG